MKKTLMLNRQTAAGFTLLEMLVVLVIIGMLAGLVGPRMFGRVDASKVKTAETQVKMLRAALETMRLDTGRFPTQDEGLSMLYSRPSGEPLASQHAWHPTNRGFDNKRSQAPLRRFLLVLFPESDHKAPLGIQHPNRAHLNLQKQEPK